MASPKTQHHKTTTQLAKAHYLYALAFSATIVIYDAAQVLTPGAVFSRWRYVIGLIVITTIVWFFARLKRNNLATQKWLIAVLVLADIIFAALVVYADRGMASLAVALFAVPIAASATLKSRSALLASASLSGAAYAYMAIKYFTDFFNEGYKVQLYTTIGFHVAMFFVLALILAAVVRQNSKTS